MFDNGWSMSQMAASEFRINNRDERISMYFWTHERLGELQPVCEAASYNLEKLATLLKIFKKETEKTYPDAKRLKNLGALIFADAEDLSNRLPDLINGGCCEAEMKTLEAQVRALPWTFQKTSGTRVVRVERYGDIIGAHRILIEAIRRAQGSASSNTRCDTATAP
jgi:hypothetical protein